MTSRLSLFIMTLLSISLTTKGRSLCSFYKNRSLLLANDNGKYIGAKIQLTKEEKMANYQLMAIKISELKMVLK